MVYVTYLLEKIKSDSYTILRYELLEHIYNI